jgi:2,4-dienoyl-CoA reductase-like NADH-dependent reductase (Old Yellow Enzyme family)
MVLPGRSDQSETTRARQEYLLDSGYIENVRTRNRIAKTAAGTGLLEKNGTIGRVLKAHYQELTGGSVGLIILEFYAVGSASGLSFRG